MKEHKPNYMGAILIAIVGFTASAGIAVSINSIHQYTLKELYKRSVTTVNEGLRIGLAETERPLRNLAAFRSNWAVDEKDFERLAKELSEDTDYVVTALVDRNTKVVHQAWRRRGYNALPAITPVTSPQLVAVMNEAGPKVTIGTVENLGDGTMIALVAKVPHDELCLVGLVKAHRLMSRLNEPRHWSDPLTDALRSTGSGRVNSSVEQLVSFKITEQRTGLPPVTVYESEAGVDDAKASQEIPMQLGTRKWQVQCQPTALVNWRKPQRAALHALAIGLSFTILLTAYVVSLARSRARIQFAHAETELALDQLELHHRHVLDNEQKAAKICREILQPMTVLMLAHSNRQELPQNQTEILGATVKAVDNHLRKLLDVLSSDKLVVKDDFRQRLQRLDAAGTGAVNLSRRVLVIEDDEGIRNFVYTCLTHLGFEVEIASDGPSGLKLATSRDFGVILTDIMLPGKTGIQIYQETIKQKPEQRFLFMSGFAVRNDWVPIIEQSVGFLEKPFDAFQLQIILERIYKPERKRSAKPQQNKPEPAP